MINSKKLIIVCAVFLAVSSGCSNVKKTPQQIVKGEEIYDEKCSMCHPSIENLTAKYPDKSKMQELLYNISSFKSMQSVKLANDEVEEILQYMY